MDAEREATFGSLVGRLDYPMLLVTAADGSEADGCLVGFSTQASIDPPRFAVHLSETNRTYRLARRAAELGVHFLSRGDEDLAELFGGETGDEVDKLSRVAWRPSDAGTPLLDRCPNRFLGRILDRRAGGDHVAFLLEPVAAWSDGALDPLPFHRVRGIEAGHDA